MRTKIFFGLVLFFFALGCEKVDFDPSEFDEEITELESNLVLKSATGYSSVTGEIYVQQGVGVGLKVEGKSSPVVSVSWTIEGSNYEGMQIAHKFSSLGEINLEVIASFENGTTETRSFTVHSVLDISEVDPVKFYTYDNGDGTWNILVLISKERIRHSTSNVYYFDGLVVDWEKKVIPEGDHNYIIDKNGNPQITSDVGKYIGIKFSLSARGLYNLALIHSGNNWADLSGSTYIRSENPGLVYFWFEDGEIIPQGDVVEGYLPGATGDNFFRFTQVGDNVTGKVILFFKLENDFTNASFVVRQLDGGAYSDPISMWPVTDFPKWGQIELPVTELLDKVSGFRYGPNHAYTTNYSPNMLKSFFYDDFFKSIRLTVYKI